MKPRVRWKSKLNSLVVLGALFLTSALATNCFSFGSSTENLPPLYLTIIVHNEEDTSRGTVPKANIPDYEFARGPVLHCHISSSVSNERLAIGELKPPIFSTSEAAYYTGGQSIGPAFTLGKELGKLG